MTNREFDAWVTRHFPQGDSACGRALDLNRETIKALRLGATKNGTPYPVGLHLALACAAWSMGIREFAGETLVIGDAVEKLSAARAPLAAAVEAIDQAVRRPTCSS